MDLDSVLCTKTSAYFAAYDDGSRLDLAFDFCPFAYNKSVGRKDFTSKNTPNSDGATEAELTFELTALINDTGNNPVRAWYRKGRGSRHLLILQRFDQPIKLLTRMVMQNDLAAALRTPQLDLGRERAR